MARKQSRTTHVKGDINVKNGDVVAGDKNIKLEDDRNVSSAEISTAKQRGRKAKKSQVIHGNLEVQDGDVVFGDKIIQFLQKTLNVYLFKDLKQLAFFLGVVILVVSGISGGIWYSRQPRVMDGDFNIAVAQFGEYQPDGTIKPSARAEKISNTLFNFMDGEFQASNFGLKVQTSHKNMPLILEDSQAKALAKKVHADIVIYGNIFSQDNQAEFSPRFYVAEKADANELTGQDELASPIDFDILQLNTEDQINNVLRTRAKILFYFTKSLIYFSQNNPDPALQAIQTAISSAENLPKPFAGEEVLYLVAAKIHISRKEFEIANKLLEQALILNPNYARAHLARGNIYYTLANDANFDSELLGKALAEYQLAYQAKDQPEGAYIPIKAHTALGNIYVVMAEKTDDPDLYSKAFENYDAVINEYSQTKDPFLQSYAATAYFGLGGAYEYQGNIEQAIKAYQRAYDLAEDPVFKERIRKQIATAQAS